MRSLDEFAAEKLRGLEMRHLRRKLAFTTRETSAYVTRGGRRLVSFSCNDYLGLSTHPAVIDAAVTALRTYGLGAGGSRLVTGNHPLYAGLEARLARLKESETALVFGSGYLANLGIVPALAGKGDLVLADALSHACLLSGARLSQAEEVRYPHNDVDAVERVLAKRRTDARHALIVTDGVFSMDGDLAPLPALTALAERYDAWLLVDDAHGLGVVGNGHGSAFAFGSQKVDVPLQMGTLSKAVGAYGGYLCASAAVIELLKNRARSFVYSTGLPPAVLAGAAAALDVIAENPDLVARPLVHARNFTRSLDLPDAQSAIVPLILGSAERALAAAALLEEAGFLVSPIRPPTVPDGTARLRFAFSAAHEATDLAKLAETVRARVLPLRSSP
jgi:8-amino-7-oxononanoate synthase